MGIVIENIGEYLKSHGIKPSYQRIKIFEYLVKNKNHPTVDMIYKAIIEEIPTLSKTTVYNTLNLFIEKKIVIMIVIEENETRYDADVNLHAHFKCENCGEIKDIEISPEKADILELNGYQVNEHHIYFKGICDECLEKDKK
jgi:Fe2+ or Zn2+ uptake regulation protein